MTEQLQKKIQAAEEYATKYFRRSSDNIRMIAKMGFLAGANWASQPQNVTDR